MLMGLDDGPDLEQESFNALFSRFNQQFAVVLTDILAQKIKPFFNIRHFRFLGG